MSKETKDIVQEAKAFVRQYMMEHQPAHFFFHNYGHAEELAEEAEKLAKKANLSEQQTEELQLAAWFHDTGFHQNYDQYSDASAEVADEWLQSKNYPEASRMQVVQLIKSAQREEDTDDHLEQLFHDVRWSWLGRKRFSRRAPQLRLEKEQQKGEKYNSKDWAHKMLDLLMETAYQSPEGQLKYNDRRNRNVADQRSSISKIAKDVVKRLSGKNYGRGIDTLYRTSFRNHINLSRIADGKANMMISINTIVLSIILAVSGAGIGIVEDQIFENPSFILPVITLLLSSLTALVFAVFSARPKVTEYNIGQRIDINREASLLYFGNFLQLPKEKFIEYLADIRFDQDKLYNDLSKDLYDLGGVLHKKYRLLTISYNIFVGGLVMSVGVFLAVYMVSI